MADPGDASAAARESVAYGRSDDPSPLLSLPSVATWMKCDGARPSANVMIVSHAALQGRAQPEPIELVTSKKSTTGIRLVRSMEFMIAPPFAMTRHERYGVPAAPHSSISGGQAINNS
jgi:hypothetical protein